MIQFQFAGGTVLQLESYYAAFGGFAIEIKCLLVSSTFREERGEFSASTITRGRQEPI